jgi:hypothetical protein
LTPVGMGKEVSGGPTVAFLETFERNAVASEIIGPDLIRPLLDP